MHSCAYFSFPCIEMLCKWNTSYQMVRASNLQYEELYFWLPWYDISSCDREQDYPSNNVHILRASKDPYLCVLGPMQLTLDHSVLLYVHCGSDLSRLEIKKVTGEIEITGGENLLLTVDELKL